MRERRGRAGEGGIFVILTLTYPQNEGTIFIYTAFPKPLTAQAFFSILVSLAGPIFAYEIAKEYPVSDYNNSYNAALLAIWTDVFRCGGRSLIRSIAAKANGSTSTYLYAFDHVPSWTPPILGEITISTFVSFIRDRYEITLIATESNDELT